MTVTGFDVSELQGSIDWRSAATGHAFAFVKAFEHRPDHNFAANWIGAKRAGLVRGAYCFGRPGSIPDGRVQAQMFTSTIPALGGGDLPLVLDLEDAGGFDPTRLVSWAIAFLEHCDAVSLRRSILYTYSDFLRNHLASDRRLARWELWIADYAPAPPRTPWPWTFWQGSSTGGVPGIAGRVDLDLFAGSLDELHKLAGYAPNPQPHPVADGDLMAGRILIPDNAQPWPPGGTLVAAWEGLPPTFDLDVAAGELRGYNGASVKPSHPTDNPWDQFGISHQGLPPNTIGYGETAKRDGLWIITSPAGGGYFMAYPDGAAWAGRP